MIERIRWPSPNGSEPESPFDSRSSRPLRLTFHAQSLKNLEGEENEAYHALAQFTYLDSIKAVSTASGRLPQINVEFPDHDMKDVDVEVSDGSHRTCLSHFGHWKALAKDVAQQHDESHPDFQQALREITFVGASNAIRHDVFISSSETLIKSRNKVFIKQANVRTPLEAARIVGLFLRSRRIYTVAAAAKFQRSTGRGGFYWTAARARLPSMWRYFGACLDAGRARKDDTGMVAQSVLVRCARAHEARDSVIRLLYIPQDNSVRDEMMYHFEYLTLLLGGALDAQARIAHRAYKIAKPDEKRAGFRNSEFRDALKSDGAANLCKYLGSAEFTNASTLVSLIRNTIHGASMMALAYHEGGEPQRSLVEVAEAHRDELWGAAEALGSATRWGLRKRLGRVYLEPASYAQALVAEACRCVDTIATLTDVAGLFSPGQVLGQYPPPSADDDMFGSWISSRVLSLG